MEEIEHEDTPEQRGSAASKKDDKGGSQSGGGGDPPQQVPGRFLSGLVCFRIALKAKSCKTLKLGNTLALNY
jgi:hypothetical protein